MLDEERIFPDHCWLGNSKDMHLHKAIYLFSNVFQKTWRKETDEELA